MDENKKINRLYILYDNRARFNVDEATILETCDTLKEAIEDCKRIFSGPLHFYPLIYSYDQSGKYLSDERLEYDSLQYLLGKQIRK
jgi:hypothetical protein